MLKKFLQLKDVHRFFIAQAFFVGAILFFPFSVSAHVGYVIDQSEIAKHSGTDWGFIFSPFLNPLYLILFAITILAIVFGVVFFKNNSVVKKINAHIRRAASSYGEYIPWICRLSLGIALLGAGAHRVLIAPIVPISGYLAFVETALGFLLLLGLFLPIVGLLIFILFLVAFFTEPSILGNLDFLGLLISFFLLSDNRPGADHLLGLPFPKFLEKYKVYVPVVLRLSLGFTMMYLALSEKLLHPHTMELVIQKFQLTSVLPVSSAMWVFSTGAIEFIIGALLVAGWYIRLTSLIAFLVLSATFFYFGEDIYSHVTLFATCSILFVFGSGESSILRGKLRRWFRL